MADDTPEEITPPPESGRAKRPPPTIDLEASEVSGGKGDNEDAPAGASAAPQPQPSSSSRSAAPISAMVTSAVTGAVTAALVIAAAWYVGWPGETASQAATPPGNTAAIAGNTMSNRSNHIHLCLTPSLKTGAQTAIIRTKATSTRQRSPAG